MTPRSFRLAIVTTVVLLLASGASVPWAADKDSSDPYYRQRPAHERGEFQYDDSQDVPWREAGATVPPPPADDAALGQLRLDNLPKAFTAYLDTATLNVDPTDGVIRYWLVVRAGSSATTSYEGMNCGSREYKTYAFADAREPNGLRAVRDPKWQVLGFGRSNDYRWELADSYLCIGTSAKAPKDVVGTIRGYYQRQNPFSEYTDNTRSQIP